MRDVSSKKWMAKRAQPVVNDNVGDLYLKNFIPACMQILEVANCKGTVISVPVDFLGSLEHAIQDLLIKFLQVGLAIPIQVKKEASCV